MDADGPGGMVLLFGLFAVIVIIALIYQYVMREKRRGEWASFATSLALRFSPKDHFSIPKSEPHGLFRRGHSRRARHVLYGRFQGRDIKCFDYQYTVGSGDDSRTYHMTCLIIKPPIPFRQLEIRPESFSDKVGEFFGADDIDFESDEFSRKFHVKCSDPKFAYDVIHARTMQFMLGHKPLAIEARGRSVLLRYAKEQQLPLPHGVTALLETGCDFIDLLPEYLIKQHGSEAGL